MNSNTRHAILLGTITLVLVGLGLATLLLGVDPLYIVGPTAIVIGLGVLAILIVLNAKDEAVSGYRDTGSRMKILADVSKHDKAFMPQITEMMGLLDNPGFRTRLSSALYAADSRPASVDEAAGRLLARLQYRRRKTRRDVELRASLGTGSELFNVHMTIAECPQDFLTVIEALHLMKLFDDIRRVRFLRIAQQLVDDDYEERGQPLGLQGEHLPSTKYANLR